MLAQIAARGSFRGVFALKTQPQRSLLQQFGFKFVSKRPALPLNATRHFSWSSNVAQDKKEGLVALSERAQQARQVNLRAKLQSPEVKPSASRREFTRLFELVKSERKALTVGLLLLVFTSGISLTLPAVIGKILDAVNDPNPEKMIFGLPLNTFFTATMCVFATGAVALYFRIVVMRSIGERIVARLRARVFRRIVEQDAEFFDANRTGDLISRLGNDANVVSRAVTQNVADGLRSVLTAVMGVSAMAYISPQMTVLIGAVLPPVLIGTWLYGRKVRAIALNFQKGLGELTRVAEERLNNIRTAQSFGCETLEMRLYNKEIRKVFGIAMQDAKASGIYSGTMQLTGNTVVIGLLAYGASMVSSGSLTFGELSSFIMYTAFAGSAVSGLGNFYSELMKGAGAAQRLFEVEDRKPVIAPFKGDKLINPRGDIVFEKVKFAYPTRPAVEIFSDLSVKIKAGSHVVIVGQSGGGKSTIISLLMRFYDPTFGNITIGGQKLADMSPWALRHQIGIVAQEPVLFSGSIADNIRYGKPGASDQDVLTAAMQANCTFLSDFPEGLDTMVGPRGAQLSGGQKQRIAIARAIISKPAILILDEATSALDGESEMLVNEALNKLIRSTATTISIAHRLSTIARAEEVIVLGQGGTVVEQGPFNELYSKHDSALSKLLLKRHEMPLPNQNQKEHEDEPEDIIVDEVVVDEILESEAEKSKTKL